VELQKKLKLSEWIRFTSSDPTVMGTLYKTLSFEWLFMSPIILAWKVIIIIPAVFLPSNSFEQRVGVASAQFAFTVFIFFTSPFISPIVDAMYRLGCVHQLLFLGVESLNHISKYEGQGGLQNVMITITLTYLVLAVVLMFWTNIAPVVQQILDTKTTTSILEKLGFQYSLTTSLYVVPDKTGVERVDREAIVDDFRL
jgi:hypothetical protein